MNRSNSLKKLIENPQDEFISNHLILVLRALIAHMHIFQAAAVSCVKQQISNSAQEA